MLDPASVTMAARFFKIGGFSPALRPICFAAALAYVFRKGRSATKIKVVVHEAEEAGFRAEVAATPGCATQGEVMEELMRNLHEAI